MDDRADGPMDTQHPPEDSGGGLAEIGPRGTRSLISRGVPLAPAAAQRDALRAVPMDREFSDALSTPLLAGAVDILQINIGRLCNMACRHCHVDAGPDRTVENMDRATVDGCVALLDATGAKTVDITGGAPELNPHFRHLVDACVSRGVHVIDRCNLTVLLLARFSDLPEWLGERGVEVVASLPHHRPRNTDAQRGDGAFSRSVEALQRLNAAGYGVGDPRRVLTLMHNPAGAFLPGGQAGLEEAFRRSLRRQVGVRFDRLIALNNMPIARFLEWLLERDLLDEYMETLSRAFNPAAVSGLMCRNTLSVSWDGRLFDCDFNQMLEMPVLGDDGTPLTVWSGAAAALAGRQVRTDRHCFGCTAGAGSSCGGATSG